MNLDMFHIPITIIHIYELINTRLINQIKSMTLDMFHNPITIIHAYELTSIRPIKKRRQSELSPNNI